MVLIHYLEGECVMSVLRVHDCQHSVVAMAEAWASALTLPKLTAAFKSQTLGQAEMSALSAEATLTTTCLSEGETMECWISEEGGGASGSFVAAVVVTGGVRAAGNGDSATGAPGQALWPTGANGILGARPVGGLADATHITAIATPTLMLIPSLFALSEGAREAQAELAATIEVWSETHDHGAGPAFKSGCTALLQTLTS